MKHEHYYRDVQHLDTIDVYRVLELFEVTCPVMQHIVKKALCSGNRGHKDLQTDVQDIVDSAQRKLEMMGEDARKTWATDETGWTPWYGASWCPVDSDCLVEVTLRSGHKNSYQASTYAWSHDNQPHDIIAYRIVK